MDGSSLTDAELRRAIAIRGFFIPMSVVLYLLSAKFISDAISASTIHNPSDFLLVNKMICLVGSIIAIYTLVNAVELKKIENSRTPPLSPPTPLSRPLGTPEPEFPYARFIIMSIVIPFLSLSYIVYAISLVVQLPTHATGPEDLHLIVTWILAIIFAFIAYICFGFNVGLRKEVNENIEKVREENLERLEVRRKIEANRAADAARQADEEERKRRLERERNIAEALYRTNAEKERIQEERIQAERAKEVADLERELARLKSIPSDPEADEQES